MDITPLGMRILSTLLQDFPLVTIACNIFQSYSEKYGNGVCRGIIQAYISAYIDTSGLGMPELLDACRTKLSNMHDPKNISSFKTLHEDYKHHRGKMPDEPAFTRVMSLGRQTGTLANRGLQASALFSGSRTYFVGNGVYFIALNRHAVALVNHGGTYRFIDPNTCEFECPDLTVFCNFLQRYYTDFIQGGFTDGPILYTIFYNL